jgi:hypothetical protein
MQAGIAWRALPRARKFRTRGYYKKLCSQTDRQFVIGVLAPPIVIGILALPTIKLAANCHIFLHRIACRQCRQ